MVSKSPRPRPSATYHHHDIRPSVSVSPSDRPVTPTPTLTPAPTTPTPTPSLMRASDSGLRAQVITLINQQRAQAGVQELTTSARISEHCQEWATHLASQGSLAYSAMGAAGEVIASGPTSAETVVQTWLNDPHDQAVLMNPSFSRVGSGYVNGYWVVQFG